MHDLMLVNDSILPTSARVLSPGQVGAVNGWGVFSTLRVHNGVLFAWERHFARMSHDARLLHVPFPSDANWMRSELLRLVEANNATDATLRVIVMRNKGGPWEGEGVTRPADLIAFTTALKAWGDSVRLAIHPQARHAANRYAGTKVLSWSFNLAMYEEAQAGGFDEVVLLNERGEVSELTSASIFAIFGNDVVTPPLSSGCLPGVTRALILEELALPGLTIREAALAPVDLENADELFITSSTRDLIPVAEIDTLTLRHAGRGVLPALQHAFQHLLASYCIRP